MDLQQRVERLERENRRLKMIGLILLFLAVVVLTWQLGIGQAQPVYAQEKGRVLRAETFELVDGDGNVRAVLKTQGAEGAELVLRDGKGEDFFRVFGYKDGGGTFYLQSKAAILNAAANKNGVNIALYKDKDRPRVGMLLLSNGKSELFVKDRNGDYAFVKTGEN